MSQQYPQGEPQYAAGEPQGPQGPQQGWQQQGYQPGTPPKPPKKPFFKRTWVIVTGSVLALFVVIGIAGNGGDSKNAASTTDAKASTPASSAPSAKPPASTKPSASAKPATKAPATTAPATKAPATTQAPANTTCEGSRNDPCPVTLGVAFTVGKHKVDRGWKLKTEQYLGTKLIGKLSNVSDEPSTAFFTVRFLKGNELVANFQCSSSSELQPQQSEAIECYNMSDVQKTLKKGSYDKITAQADF